MTELSEGYRAGPDPATLSNVGITGTYIEKDTPIAISHYDGSRMVVTSK